MLSTNVFAGTKTPREILQYNLFRGVTDFRNAEQFDLFTKGFPFLVVVKVPDVLEDLADADKNGTGKLVKNYVHILENDFKGIDNIDNLTGEGNEITNGISSINLINNITFNANAQFNMQYYERSGSILTKGNELLLTAIGDPRTKVKHYHGLVDNYKFYGGDGGSKHQSGKDPGPHHETFTFMYFVTDNTMTEIEKAFLFCNAQPTAAPFSDLYDGNKGEISYGELSLGWNATVLFGDQINIKAQKMLLAMRNPKNLTGSRVIVDSTNFTYKGIEDIDLGENEDEAKGVWWNEGGQITDPNNFNHTNNGSMNITDAADEGYTGTLSKIDNRGGEHYVSDKTAR